MKLVEKAAGENCSQLLDGFLLKQHLLAVAVVEVETAEE
jgi:hypothetical protein